MRVRGNPVGRLVAPALLLIFLVAFLVVVVSSLGGGNGAAEETETTPAPSQRTADGNRGTRGGSGGGPARTYVVKPGDNLVRIADRTGVPIETIQELNPTLDPQALVSGQRVRLRE